MVNPKTVDFIIEEKISKKVMVENPLCRKLTILVASFECTLKYEPTNATKAQYKPRIGTVIVAAITRVETKYLKGLIDETSMASICSVTRIDPNSAPMLDPILPAQINAVTNEAKALTMAIETKEGNQDVAPNSANEGRDCLVNTIPVIKPVSVMSGNDFIPIS